MIEVQGLTKKYGDRFAIESLNFKVNKGEVVGFLGPNGAGKSTTMKILTGYMAPTAGSAQIDGFDVFENPIEVKKRIGYLPETPPVYNDMYVQDYLRYVAKLKGVNSAKISSQVDMAIQKMNLQDVRKRMIHNLSKGFKQRVGIAQAIVSDPDVLILDEPTVGLDPKQVAEIRHLIKELRSQHTIILSTHILPEVEAVCERIIIINNGKIVAQDSLQNLSKTKSGSRKLHVKVKKTGEQVGSILKGVSGVQKLYSGTSAQEWILDADDNDAVIEQVAKEIMAKNLGLLEIGSAKIDLEDVFLKLTYENNSAKEITHG